MRKGVRVDSGNKWVAWGYTLIALIYGWYAWKEWKVLDARRNGTLTRNITIIDGPSRQYYCVLCGCVYDKYESALACRHEGRAAFFVETDDEYATRRMEE